MKILVLGAGAIGGYYGARLLQAGADVSFAVRAQRRDALDREGLAVHSALGNFNGPVRTVDAKAIGGTWDAVLLACKGYDLAQAIDDVAPAIGPDSVLLPFLNGVGVRATVGQILATAPGRTLVERAIAECEAVAAAEAHPVRGEGAARTRALLLDPASGWMASMMRDIAGGARHIEHEQIVGDMTRLARRHGIDTPLLDAAYCHLQAYERIMQSR